LSAARVNNKGISTACETASNTEKDGYRIATVSGRFDLNPSSRIAIDPMVRCSDGKADIEHGSGVGGDDSSVSTNK
jgi:hypothetical protein